MEKQKNCPALEMYCKRILPRLKLSPKSYLSKVLEQFLMLNSKPCQTSTEKQFSYDHLGDEEFFSTTYRQCIVSLMYLMICTRRDIAIAVSRLSWFMETATISLWTCVNSVFRYLIGTRDLGIMLGTKNCISDTVIGYSASYWARCKPDRKSSWGSVFKIAGGAVSWKSKKQTVVATSTAEEEYVALCSVCLHSSWIGAMLNFVPGALDLSKILIIVDIQAAIKIARNDVRKYRTKHNGIEYDIVRAL